MPYQILNIRGNINSRELSVMKISTKIMDFEDDNSSYISSSKDSADISNDNGLCAKDCDGEW